MEGGGNWKDFGVLWWGEGWKVGEKGAELV